MEFECSNRVKNGPPSDPVWDQGIQSTITNFISLTTKLTSWTNLRPGFHNGLFIFKFPSKFFLSISDTCYTCYMICSSRSPSFKRRKEYKL